MPELPDLEVYVDALRRHALGQPLERIRLASPFLLRSVEPPLSVAEGRHLEQVRRLGKRLVLELEEELYLVLHLMIAGRLRWREASVKIPRKLGLAAFDFPAGSLLLTEAGSKKRVSLHLVESQTALANHDPGGLEVLAADPAEFFRALQRRNHTLKRALTDPRILAGIGNAYSDEILHRAKLSPFKRTAALADDEVRRLFEASRGVLTEWISRLRAEVGEGFPDKVTAFRPEMAAHGRFGQPCPVCTAPIQRIVYAENEANYCPGCQTDGRVLADRVLSRLLKGDWPRSLDELERQPPTSEAR